MIHILGYIEEVVLGRCLERLEAVHGAEFKGGGGPDVHHLLLQTAVDQVISGKDNLNHFVVEVVQDVFPGIDFALAPGSGGKRQGTKQHYNFLHFLLLLSLQRYNSFRSQKRCPFCRRQAVRRLYS